MKFYKQIVIPCTTSIPDVQKAAKAQNCTLLACNNADIADLCEAELEYVGQEAQTLLFLVKRACDETDADRRVELIKEALLDEQPGHDSVDRQFPISDDLTIEEIEAQIEDEGDYRIPVSGITTWDLK